MRTLTVLLALVLAGCDVPAPGAAPSPATPATAEAPAQQPATVPAATAGTPPAAPPAAAPAGTLGDCIATCDHGKLSRTDRATCRLNCETVHGVTAQAPTGAEDPVGQAMHCLRACHRAGGDTAACAGSCRNVAGALPNAPAAAVLAELETCVAGCQTERVAVETDRATCELTCEQNARVAGPAQPGTP